MPHVCYCYTPSHYAWPPATDEPTGDHDRCSGRSRLLRRVDRRAAESPDSYVAISEAVRQRIHRYYGREATVIHPPVDVSSFAPAEKEPGHFLWVQRLVSHKRPSWSRRRFEGCRTGDDGRRRADRRTAPENLPGNVELLGWLPRAELTRSTAAPPASSTSARRTSGSRWSRRSRWARRSSPSRRGGAVDIVRPDVDGVLIDEPELDALRAAIVTTADREWDTDALVARAREFSTQRFVERFEAHLRALGVG